MSSQSPPAKKAKVKDLALNGEANGMPQSAPSAVTHGASSLVSNGANNGSSSTVGDGVLPGEIDDSRYNRQYYVLGREAMLRMAQSDILISGLDGLGVEVAKCVVLSGVRGVTLHDTVTTTKRDLTAQYYLTEADIGKNRAEACLDRIAELNGYVHTRAHVGELTPEFVKQFTAVVLCGPNRIQEAARLSEFLHPEKKALILAEVSGVFGLVFCDFGPEFNVLDTTGENPVTAHIASITKECEALVACVDETRHGFQDGDYVTFAEIKGMTQLNGCEPVKIKVKGQESFTIGDTTGFDDYITSGVAIQAKMPVKVAFKPLPEFLCGDLKDGDYLVADFAKYERPPAIFSCFRALNEFRTQFKRDPKAFSAEDAAALVKCAGDLGISTEDHVKFLQDSFASACSGVSMAMASVIGGIVGQEVMKACSGKFMPIKQFFLFDSLESLPEGRSEVDCQTTEDRYGAQVECFGRNLQTKLANTKVFVVGAGAIGCELLKNFAMMGISTGPKGKIIVTDMDTIEKSNLNRQFLFREGDVQKTKSNTAAAAIKAMNPNVIIEAHQNRVGPETEKDYPDSFMESLDLVANALDNLDARSYMDRRCVYYRKPLLESGTLGTKGNVQVVLPHLTESYTSSRDPPEKDIPACTLHNFPNAIEHTLAWSRDKFEGFFKSHADNAAAYLNDAQFVEKTMKLSGIQPLETLESVHRSLVKERPNNFMDCVTWARNVFEDLFNNQIVQMLFNFPPDQKTSTGAPFWSGPKRCPVPIKFNSKEEMHLDLVIAAANIRASVYAIKENRDRAAVAVMADSVVVTPFKPKSGVVIAVTDAEHSSQMSANTDQDILNRLRSELPSREQLKGKVVVKPVDFEKDDETNFHMDFITAASNLRATNYSITPADRLQSKLIAGRIIPAIATTTAMIAGFVSLELFKLVAGKDKLEDYKNGFVNLALPFFGFSEPIAPPKKKYYEHEFTLWDRFEVAGEMSLKDFLAYFKEKHRLTISMLSHGNALLYAFFLTKDKLKDRENLMMSEVVRKVTKRKVEPHVRALVFEITCEDEEGEDVEVPYIKYNLAA